MKLTVEYIPLDRGGYEPSGRYWGHGGPLYRVTNEDDSIDEIIRAPNARQAAAWVAEKHKVVRTFPRRRPTPKDVRERAARAGAYADEVYERARSVDRMFERRDQFGGYETQGYKQALADDMRAAVEAADVAADAFEEAGQMRLADKYRKQVKDRGGYLAYFERLAYTAEGNENLSRLLNRDAGIGPEREVRIAPRWQSGLRALTRNANVTMFMNPYGSYRYIAFDGTTPASVVQIMSRDGREGVIANVYTAPNYRRHGWATRLLDIARRRFRVLSHSTDLSPAGAAWAERQRP